MGQLRAVLSNAFAEGHEPADALRRVNRFAAREVATRAATMCVVVVETDGSAMAASHAHPLPLVVGRDGTTRRLPAVGSAPLGSGGQDAVWQRLGLDVGDMLLLFTDGLVERRDRTMALGMESLAATMAAARRDADGDVLGLSTSLPATPVERVATLIVERMAFLGEGYADDVTVLIAQHQLEPLPLSLNLEATLGALRTARQTLIQWLDELGADPDEPTRSSTRWARHSPTLCNTPTGACPPRRHGRSGCARGCRPPARASWRSPTTDIGSPPALAHPMVGGGC
jgi:hypothetical protein